jgi:hypothetical protein
VTVILFCTQQAGFYFRYVSNCSGLNFKLIDTGGNINHIVNLTDERDPRQAAFNCRNEIPRGRDAFAKCWIRNASSERQRRILDCWDNSRTYASFGICANKGNMSNDEFNVANCIADYGSNSGSELVKCLARGRLSNDESRILNCALDNQTAINFATCALPPEQRRVINCVANNRQSYMAMGVCATGGQLTPEQRRIAECVLNDRGSYVQMGVCAAGQQLSPEQRRVINCVANNRQSYMAMGVCATGGQLTPEQRRIAGCVMNNRGNYIQMGVCAAGPQMTPEQQVFASCAIQTGMQPYAFAGCVGTQLTVNELQKCIDQGIGGSGCFGDNNTAVKTVRNAWKDVTEGPGHSNDLFGGEGFTGQALENIRRNAPPPIEIGSIGGHRVCIPWC